MTTEWKLVPVEPTEEMARAHFETQAHRAGGDGPHPLLGSWATWEQACRISGFAADKIACLRAAIATSPPPPEDRGGWQPITPDDIEQLRFLSGEASHAEGMIDPDPAPFDKANSVRIRTARDAWRAFDAHLEALKLRASPPGSPLTDTGSGNEQRSDPIPDPRDTEIARLREALTRLRDCDWVIGAGDRMDPVREIARLALGAP